MSKYIEISDEVFRRLERERGSQSISAMIAELLESEGSLQDVTGQGIFAPGSYEAIKERIRTSSEGTDQGSDEFNHR